MKEPSVGNARLLRRTEFVKDYRYFCNIMNTPYLATKARYEILDGLRGVAALMVVLFHVFESYSRGPAYQIINHGYLAVDFFFVLSGFVIGYAYDDRWKQMSVWAFVKRRLSRLHPMVFMGSTIGLLLFYFGAGPVCPAVAETPCWLLLAVWLLGCLLIPAPNSLDIRGWQETYALNGPQWTLMFEYIANLLYALVVRRFPVWLLGMFVAVAAVLTLNLALNIDMFGLLANRIDAAYTVIGGWSLEPAQLLIGFTRLFYPFFCGLLIFRIGKRIRMRGAFWACSAAIVVLLAMPRIGGLDEGWKNGIYDAACILLLFPAIVMAGAGGRVQGKRSIAVCRFLGEISYPLYITHYPLIYLQMTWAVRHPELPLAAHVMVGVATLLLAVGIAYACLKLYDIPVRRWLMGGKGCSA